MNKQTESIFKNESGDKIHVVVQLGYEHRFIIQRVGITPKGKRNIRWIGVTDDYSYRVLNLEGRRAYEMARWLEIATQSMLNEAIMNAWMALKPEIVEE